MVVMDIDSMEEYKEIVGLFFTVISDWHLKVRKDSKAHTCRH